MAKQEVLAEVQLTREGGHIYFLDKAGDIGRRKRQPGHHDKRSYNYPNEKVMKLGVKKVPGYLYFLGRKKVGDKYVPGVIQARRVPMQRGRKS